MSFISFQFLIFIFLTATVYFIVPGKWKWVVLLLSSYIYFFINSEWLILILFAETLVTFLTGLMIEQQADAHSQRLGSLKESISKEEKRKLLSAWKNAEN